MNNPLQADQDAAILRAHEHPQPFTALEKRIDKALKNSGQGLLGGMEEFLVTLIKRRGKLLDDTVELQQLDERITEILTEVERIRTIIPSTFHCRRYPPCRTCGESHSLDDPTYYICGFPCDNCGKLHNPYDGCQRPTHHYV